MMSVLAIVAIVVVWVLLMKVILPRLGVPTWMSAACAVEPRQDETSRGTEDPTGEVKRAPAPNSTIRDEGEAAVRQ